MADDLGDDIAEFATSLPGGSYDAGEQSAPLNAEQANWMLRKLNSLEQQRSQIIERADAERRMIDAWCQDRTSGIEREQERISRALEGWMRGVFEMSGAVTQKLPAGELWLREPQQSVLVSDEAAAVKWLVGEKQFDAVKVSEQVKKIEAAKGMVPGEVIKGDAGPDHEYREARFAASNGPRIPGVLLRVPKRKTFTIHPN